MKVVIAGGTGMIGRALSGDLINAGYEVTILSRHPKSHKRNVPSGVRLSQWNPPQLDGLSDVLDASQAVVNLVGENLAGSGLIPTRWSKKRKQKLLDSRVIPGETLTAAIAETSNPPSVFVQASAVGYYGTSQTKVFTEESPPGDDFLASVCVAWERSTERVAEVGTRRAVARSAIVLSAEEGALQRLILPFKLFVGGPLGSGNQWFPWIHPIDEVKAIRFLLENDKAVGPFNLVAPNIVSNSQLAKRIGAALKRPSLIPVPGFALRIALGEVSKMVLEGQRAIPKQLENLGFTFQFPDLGPALEDVIRS